MLWQCGNRAKGTSRVIQLGFKVHGNSEAMTINCNSYYQLLLNEHLEMHNYQVILYDTIIELTMDR